MNFQVTYDSKGIMVISHDDEIRNIIDVSEIAFVEAHCQDVTLILKGNNRPITVDLKNQELVSIVIRSIHEALDSNKYNK